MSEIKDRLKEAADTCVASYDKWSSSSKDAAARESLLEAVHELRKVAARLEIEIAVSERRQAAADPIPIPAHRAQRRQFPAQNDYDDDSTGNGNGGNNHGRREFRDRGGDRNNQQRNERPDRPVVERPASGEGSQTIRIRRNDGDAPASAPTEASAPREAAPAREAAADNAAAAEEGDDKPRRGRPPLSLKRSGGEDTGA